MADSRCLFISIYCGSKIVLWMYAVYSSLDPRRLTRLSRVIKFTISMINQPFNFKQDLLRLFSLELWFKTDDDIMAATFSQTSSFFLMPILCFISESSLQVPNLCIQALWMSQHRPYKNYPLLCRNGCVFQSCLMTSLQIL